MKEKIKMFVFDALLFGALLLADRVTKFLAVEKLKDAPDVIIWNGVFQLHYLENRGAAFSMLQNATPVFVIAVMIMIVAVSFILRRIPAGKRYFAWHLCLVMIAAGGVGNLIDRLSHSYVIDFLYFSLINFPVFNVADICVTVAVFVLIFMILFVWKEDDMKFLDLKQKKSEVQNTEDNNEDNKLL